MDTKVIAIVAVVIVAVAACGIFFVMQNNNSDNPETPDTPDTPDTPTYDNPAMVLLSTDIKPVLEVFGNVNEDFVIDNKDIQALQMALKDGTASKLKYADANFDGVIDDDDISYIESIIAATYDSPVEVKLVNRYSGTNADKGFEDVEFVNGSSGDYYTYATVPTNKIAMSASANNILLMKYLGIVDEIKAVAYSGTIDSAFYPEYQYLFVDSSKTFDALGSFEYRIGGSAQYVSKELLLDHVTKDGVTLYVSGDNKGYLTQDTKKGYGITESEMLDLGIDVVRVGSAYTDPTAYYSNIATLCFVLGADVSKLSNMIDWTAKTIEEINKKLNETVGKGTVKEVNIAVSSATSYSEKSDGTISTYNYVSSDTSDYTSAVLAAGGHFALEGYDFKGSSSSAKYEDFGKWLLEYDIDKIVIIKTGSGYSFVKGEATTTAKGIETMQGCFKAFKDTESYYNNEIYVISGDAPIILRTVFAAVVLYPDLFTEDWANNLYKDYAVKFMGLSTDDLTNSKFIVSMADVDLKGH